MMRSDGLMVSLIGQMMRSDGRMFSLLGKMLPSIGCILSLLGQMPRQNGRMLPLHRITPHPKPKTPTIREGNHRYPCAAFFFAGAFRFFGCVGFGLSFLARSSDACKASIKSVTLSGFALSFAVVV